MGPQGLVFLTNVGGFLWSSGFFEEISKNTSNIIINLNCNPVEGEVSTGLEQKVCGPAPHPLSTLFACLVDPVDRRWV